MFVDLPWRVGSIDHLYKVDVSSKSRQERSELLDEVEKMIVVLEYCQKQYEPKSIGRTYVNKKLLAMRDKRFELELSFHPKFFGCIHVGVHE